MRPFVIPPSLAPAAPAQPKRSSSDAARQGRTQAALRRAGGKRVALNLRADALAAIESIKARDGLQTSLEAVSAALLAYATNKESSGEHHARILRRDNMLTF